LSFKTDIEKLIQSNLKTYRDNSDRFIADYNRELELTKEYNGRQLLELLQNADDAGSNEVYFLWDRYRTKLIISNKGEPFTSDGIKSLMLANLTTKTKISYIGNKGLGFRSILNWAENIMILSNNCKISFSENIAYNVFNTRLNLSESDKKKLRKERNLTQLTVPFPVLGVPEIIQSDTFSDWTTQIEISYRKEFESDIELQIAEIKEEILLFLNCIQKISIRINDVESRTIILNSKKTEKGNYIVTEIQDKKWKVFSRENQLPEEFQDKTKNEKQSYNLKVAFQEDLSDTYGKLFNFFPTQLSISLPCIIHGTFELNSSRNHLNESKKNEYILKELVVLLKECSLFLTRKKIDWRPYKILTTSNKSSDSKLITTFYSDLEALKKTEAIYPSICNRYNSLDETVFYTDEFNAFFMQHFPAILPELLIPLKDEVKNIFQNDKYEHENLVKKIDLLSQNKFSIILRAELIAHLSSIIPFNDGQEKFSLLINKSGKVISKNDIAFTPIIRSEESFDIPNSVKVDFMNSKLYDDLLKLLEDDFDNKEPKSRELQRTIKSVVNLQPYDSNNVIDKIITGTKDFLDDLIDIERKIFCIKEMVAALYINFKNIENRQDKLKVKVPLINSVNLIEYSENLFLSKSYPSGAITEIIYEGIFNGSDYLKEIRFWNLENEDRETVESFFLWVGVNKFSKINTISLQNNWNEKEYIDFLFENGTDKPDNFEINRIQKDSLVYKIDRFNVIEKIPVNRLVLFVLKDGFVRKQLESNEERISWYYVTWRPAIISNYSYLRYQFLKSGIFTKYVLEDGSEELNKFINEDFQIDYEFLGQFGINKAEIKSILIKLGAKESFNEIEPENIYGILKAIPNKDSFGKGRSTQTIYKLALESLVKQQSNISIPNDLLLFARKGDFENYVPNGNIYYSDNTILPKKILDTLFLLNLPKRSGEDNVEKYFGVKSLREFKIQIDLNSIEWNQYNTEFKKHFELIKPYLLAYRLESPNLKRRVTDFDTRRKESNAIKQCKIHLVNECNFSFADKTNVSIGQKEYININDDFYYKDNSIISIESIKRDSFFCDAFAEMMCIIFKVNDLKNDFRQILKNDLFDTVHLAHQDLAKDKIEEVFQLLGISRMEIEFWKRIFELKGKRLSEPVENLDVLESKIAEGLAFTLPDDYSSVDFETFGNDESYNLIKRLSIEQSLNLKQIIPHGILRYHLNKFTDTIKDLEYNFKQLLWFKFSNDLLSQSKFISVINEYNLELSSIIEDQITPLAFELNVNYPLYLGRLIQTHFNINIDDSYSPNIKIENLYNDLLLKYSMDETDLEDESTRSLLYFEGNTDVIEAFLKQQYLKEPNAESGNHGADDIIGNIIDASLSKSNREVSLTKNGGSNRTWVHSKQSERAKSRSGKAAELLVYNALKKEYKVENVKWVSGNSTTPDKNDKLHYDILYKNSNNEWKYLEVKVISDDTFIISDSEKEMGLNEPDKYEMALVSERDIYIVKNLFKFFNGESFENNSKFTAQAKDYVFSFDINKITRD
jgi:hypothetical protein